MICLVWASNRSIVPRRAPLPDRPSTCRRARGLPPFFLPPIAIGRRAERSRSVADDANLVATPGLAAAAVHARPRNRENKEASYGHWRAGGGPTERHCRRGRREELEQLDQRLTRDLARRGRVFLGTRGRRDGTRRPERFGASAATPASLLCVCARSCRPSGGRDARRRDPANIQAPRRAIPDAPEALRRPAARRRVFAATPNRPPPPPAAARPFHRARPLGARVRVPPPRVDRRGARTPCSTQRSRSTSARACVDARRSRGARAARARRRAATVLADEPGLGKTVTVLSLVLKTAGARPAQGRSRGRRRRRRRQVGELRRGRPRARAGARRAATTRRARRRACSAIAPLARFRQAPSMPSRARAAAAAGAGINLPPNPALGEGPRRRAPKKCEAQGAAAGARARHPRRRAGPAPRPLAGADRASRRRLRRRRQRGAPRRRPSRAARVRRELRSALPNAAALSQYGSAHVDGAAVARVRSGTRKGRSAAAVANTGPPPRDRRGHVLGGGGLTHRTTMMRALRSRAPLGDERRIRLAAAARDGLASLHGILAFVRHPLGVSAKAWQDRWRRRSSAAPARAGRWTAVLRNCSSDTRRSPRFRILPCPSRRTAGASRCSAADRRATTPRSASRAPTCCCAA